MSIMHNYASFTESPEVSYLKETDASTAVAGLIM